jgi:lipid II:glycine glycyltransferase (peptidoglycan interpeptide bridge formation enzyme)
MLAIDAQRIVAELIRIDWHPDLSIYASENFLKEVSDEYGWIGGVDSNGELRCILPYTVIRTAGFRMIRFRTETLATAAELHQSEELSFLNSVVEHFREAGADMIIPSGNAAVFRNYPDGAVTAPYGTFIKHLERPDDVLFNELHADCRYNVRKALKTGIEIKSGPEYLDTAVELIRETLKRTGAEQVNGHNSLKRIVSALGEHVRIFVAEYQGSIQACMVVPFSQHTAYDWYSGTTAKPERGAMHLLLWEAIRQFRACGVKRFDFQGVRIDPKEGSKQEGIYNFKMRFGGTLVRGYMWKYAYRPLKFGAYSLAMRLLRGGDIVDQERVKLVAQN